jgi:hypothetical protein
VATAGLRGPVGLPQTVARWVSYLHEHGTQLEMHPTNAEEAVNPALFRKGHQFNLATYLLFNAQATR